MTQTVLIAGASGSFGRNAALAFEQAGWHVRRLNRQSETLRDAARDVDVIVNAMNPPGYKNWATEIPRITAEVIEAARLSGATVLVPGNVYNFGDQPGPWSDETPQRACSRKGEIRIAMEAQYRRAARDGVQTIILRGGDFIDAVPSGNFFDMVVAKNATRGKITYPGTPDIPHAWAYLPDMARAAVGLAETRSQLSTFEDIAFEGYTLTGEDIRQTLEMLIGKRQKLAAFPWLIVRLASPLVPLWREILEMRYLWDHPHALDGAKLRRLLPDFVPTQVEDAFAIALELEVDPDEPVVGTHRFA